MMHGTIWFDNKYYFVFLMKYDKRKYYLSSDKIFSLKHMGVDFKPFPHFTINDKEEEKFIKENAENLVIPHSLWEERMSKKRLVDEAGLDLKEKERFSSFSSSPEKIEEKA